jgi:hypothetical protein
MIEYRDGTFDEPSELVEKLKKVLAMKTEELSFIKKLHIGTLEELKDIKEGK